MEKVSYQKIHQVLTTVPETLRKLAAERDYWKKEATERMTHDEVIKVAQAMEEKGCVGNVSRDQLIADLEKAASEGRLDNIRAAVDMMAPDMGEKLATLSNNDVHAQGHTAFESFLLGG